GWAPRAIDCESCGSPFGHLPRHLEQRALTAARARPARGSVSESADDPRNPLAVEILADHHDDPAIAKVVGRREHSTVPEGHNRTPAATVEIEAAQPFGPPRQRPSKRRDHRNPDGSNRRHLGPLQRRISPIHFVFRSSFFVSVPSCFSFFPFPFYLLPF